MPRTRIDTRTPYQKATARRVTRGLDLVAKIRAELDMVEGALSSGRYIYHTGLAEQATRLGATMAELEALEEMNDDAEAVAKLARIPDPDLDEGQRKCLVQLMLSDHGVYNVDQAEWEWISPQTTVQIFRQLAGMGLIVEFIPDGSNAHRFQITLGGRELAGRLTNE